jgi:hypothetical protein
MGSVAIRTMRRGRLAGLAALTAALFVLAGCGGEDFENRPRPPVAVVLTGVIQDDKVTVSPNQIGAGPVELTISNQTKEAHTVTLEGDTVRERVGPINPLDTATIQAKVDQGSYEVRAGSPQASTREIQPAMLDVGQSRGNSNDQLLLP